MTLIFSTGTLSSPSNEKWQWVTQNETGTNYYLYVDGISKVDGYVYFWTLSDYPKSISGVFSIKRYIQVDCKFLRFARLSLSFHKEQMGGGIGKIDNNPSDWYQASVNSPNGTILEAVCNR